MKRKKESEKSEKLSRNGKRKPKKENRGEKQISLSSSRLVVARTNGEPEDDLKPRARDGRRHRHALVDDGRVRRAPQRLGQALERVDAARDLAEEGGGVEAVALAEREVDGEGRQARDGDGGAGEVARGRRDRGVGDGGGGDLLGPPDEACFRKKRKILETRVRRRGEEKLIENKNRKKRKKEKNCQNSHRRARRSRKVPWRWPT